MEDVLQRYNDERRPLLVKYVSAGRKIAENFIQPITDSIMLPLVDHNGDHQ